MRLSTKDHDRDYEGTTYIYPVVSRRAQGVSIGINLNPNKACNWRCVYCQVDGLISGKGPPIDLGLLEQELDFMLSDVLNGDFMERLVPAGMRRLNDLAFSGDGEPTSSPDFVAALKVIGRVLEKHELTGKIKVVLITNGSLARRQEIQTGLALLAKLGGEVWFKLDRGNDEGMAAVNSSSVGLANHLENLRTTANLVPTWIQTCMFSRQGQEPTAAEQEAYLNVIRRLKGEELPLQGVLLYGLARPSQQPEAPQLSRLSPAWLEVLAEKIRALGMVTQSSY